MGNPRGSTLPFRVDLTCPRCKTSQIVRVTGDGSTKVERREAYASQIFSLALTFLTLLPEHGGAGGAPGNFCP